MPTTRVMPGIVNMEGRTVNSLKVGRMVARHPAPRYETTCERCGARSTQSQDRLTSGAARCLAANCGRVERPRGRDLLSEQRQRLAQHEAERLAEEREVSARRMEAEAGDWERPTRYAPEPQPHQVMTERERIALRERREQEEQERRETERPRLEAERKAAEERETAEAKQREREEKRVAYKRDWILSDPDPRIFVSDAMRSARMPTKDAEEFTAKQAAQFAAEPEYAAYRTLENADVILGYLKRNGVHIADAETIRGAFRRLRDLGILTKKAAPAPQPVQQAKHVNLEVAPSRSPRKQQPVVYDGWDENGNPHQYSEREVSKWSADEMKRRLRLTAASGALSLPNVGPGPSGYAR